MSYSSLASRFLFMSSLISLAACQPGAETSSNNAAPPITAVVSQPAPADIQSKVQISGKITANYAVCDVNLKALDGSSLLLNSVKSDLLGEFSAEIQQTSGMIIVEATDCTYTDEATNQIVTGKEMRSTIDLDAAKSQSNNKLRLGVGSVYTPSYKETSETINYTIQVTPFTELSYRWANLTDTDTIEEKKERLREADKKMSTVLAPLGFAFKDTPPAIPTDETASTQDISAQKHGLALSAFSGIGDINEVLETLASTEQDQQVEAMASQLLDGAATFDLSGNNKSTSNAVDLAVALQITATDASAEEPTQDSSIAPIALVNNYTLDMTAGETLYQTIPWSTIFHDADTNAASLKYRVARLPCRIKGRLGTLTGTCARPGTYHFILAVIDPERNSTSIKATLNVSPRVTEDPIPPSPHSDPTPGIQTPVTPPSLTPATTSTPPTQQPAPTPPRPTDPTPPVNTPSLPAPVLKNTTLLKTKEDSAAFLVKAGFGGTINDIQELVDTDAADWLTAQFEKPASDVLSTLLARHNSGEDLTKGQHHSPLIWQSILTGDDQLRQRVIFALSQLIVVSDKPLTRKSLEIAYFHDCLSRNAFGNYRDLLQDITYTPFMGRYLTYYGNRKGDPITGRMPDENFARELMQLFTIGLVELNMDGTPKIGRDGKEIETYTNEDIVGLAKVFTGLYANGTKFGNGKKNDPGFRFQPMKMYNAQHSQLEKTFLNYTILENTDGKTSIDLALDHIFNHPNVAPFVSRILIQRLTASHPSPEYVERVAWAFQNGSYAAENDTIFGTGERGDLKATIAAILLDTEVHSNNVSTTTSIGKIREPILTFAHWVRAFDIQDVAPTNEHSLSDTSFSLGQHPFRSPSVFNFYRPGYIAPQTLSGEQNLTVPELQLLNSGSMMSYYNKMTDFIFNRTAVRDKTNKSFTPLYIDEIELANSPIDLVTHLNLLMTSGTLTQEEQDDIISAISELPIRTATAERDRKYRVQLAITMVALSPSFSITN